MYFEYPKEDVVLRSEPNGGSFYVKFRGKTEFKAEPGSKIVADATLEGQEITKEQYDKF